MPISSHFGSLFYHKLCSADHLHISRGEDTVLLITCY